MKIWEVTEADAKRQFELLGEIVRPAGWHWEDDRVDDEVHGPFARKALAIANAKREIERADRNAAEVAGSEAAELAGRRTYWVKFGDSTGFVGLGEGSKVQADYAADAVKTLLNPTERVVQGEVMLEGLGDDTTLRTAVVVRDEVVVASFMIVGNVAGANAS